MGAWLIGKFSNGFIANLQRNRTGFSRSINRQNCGHSLACAKTDKKLNREYT
jgi:primosomal protein N'